MILTINRKIKRCVSVCFPCVLMNKIICKLFKFLFTILKFILSLIKTNNNSDSEVKYTVINFILKPMIRVWIKVYWKTPMHENIGYTQQKFVISIHFIYIPCLYLLIIALEICDVQLPLKTIRRMSTNINVNTRFEYIYYNCKIK